LIDQGHTVQYPVKGSKSNPLYTVQFVVFETERINCIYNGIFIF